MEANIVTAVALDGAFPVQVPVSQRHNLRFAFHHETRCCNLLSVSVIKFLVVRDELSFPDAFCDR